MLFVRLQPDLLTGDWNGAPQDEHVASEMTLHWKRKKTARPQVKQAHVALEGTWVVFRQDVVMTPAHTKTSDASSLLMAFLPAEEWFGKYAANPRIECTKSIQVENITDV